MEKIEIKSIDGFIDYFVALLSKEFQIKEIILATKWNIETLERVLKYKVIRERKRQAKSDLSKSTRRAILRLLDEATCQHCGSKVLYWEVDHLQKIEDGGTNDLDNIVVSCYECNRTRKKFTDEELKELKKKIKEKRKKVVWKRLEKCFESRFGRYLLRRFLAEDLRGRT